MQGDKAIIRLLNAVLTNELTAINQYFLHARMYENWGFARLGKITYEESISEMKHADKLIHRILFLDGLPNLQDLHKLHIGETVGECLTADLAVETGGRATLIEGVKLTEQSADFVSRELLQTILSDTEHHIDFLETQLSLLKSLGEANYLQSAMGELPAG
ncbi:bacterioferritin [Phenylobacterium sp.]|jgi:bacterioferritin|uniref:bacterioferritin n=1 Tax=Phenylobacterium sp. TaxID=1871053 RepID=UPI0037CA2FC1